MRPLPLAATAALALALLLPQPGLAQPGINYQAVLRDGDGAPLADVAVDVAAVFDDGAGGRHDEEHATTTDAFGLVNLTLGSPEAFAALDWSGGTVTAELTMSSAAGVVTETVPVGLAPYALYAEVAGSGEPGPRGAEGPVGPQGPAGPTGPRGPRGEEGAVGPPGRDGAGVNIVGSVPDEGQLPDDYGGATGDLLLVDATGGGYVWDGEAWVSVGRIQGPPGPTGPAGAEGGVGPAGPRGATGPAGPAGPRGETGARGPAGPAGIQGERGPIGERGPAGPQGSAGSYAAGPGISIVDGVIANTGDPDPDDDLTTSTPLGGDLGGVPGAAEVVAIDGAAIAGTPQTGSVLKWVGGDANGSGAPELRWSEEAAGSVWSENAGGTEASYNGTRVTATSLFFPGGDPAAGLAYNGSDVLALGHSGVAVRLGVDLDNQFAALYPSFDASVDLGAPGLRWANVWSSNGQIQTSDARLKTAVAAIPYGLREVLALRPVSYRWRDAAAGDEPQIGFLAQEVEPVVPEAVVPPSPGSRDGVGVSGGASADVYGMRYQALVPVLVRAIQEQQAQLERLGRRVAELEGGGSDGRPSPHPDHHLHPRPAPLPLVVE